MYEERLRSVAQDGIKALIWTMFWYALTQSISFLAMALGFCKSIPFSKPMRVLIQSRVWRSSHQYWRVHKYTVLHGIHWCHLLWRGRCGIFLVHDKSNEIGYCCQLRLLAAEAQAGRTRGRIEATVR
jgi:hypothetical protein